MAKAELTKKIYSLGAVCGIVDSGSHDDELHLIVHRVSGKSSVRELTEDEAISVINELKEYLKLMELEKNAPPPSSLIPMSNEQKAFAFRLIYRLIALDEEPSAATPRERLCGVVSKVVGYHVNMSQDLFKDLSQAQGTAVIEELKRYIKTAQLRKIRNQNLRKEG